MLQTNFNSASKFHHRKKKLRFCEDSELRFVNNQSPANFKLRIVSNPRECRSHSPLRSNSSSRSNPCSSLRFNNPRRSNPSSSSSSSNLLSSCKCRSRNNRSLNLSRRLSSSSRSSIFSRTTKFPLLIVPSGLTFIRIHKKSCFKSSNFRFY